MKDDIIKEVELPKPLHIEQHGYILKIKGPKGEVSREFHHPKVLVQVVGGKITLTAKKATKREKRNLGTFMSHIKNIIQGVQEPYVYKLKICSGHFPMSVSVSGKVFILKNFFGESIPRKVTLPDGVQVKINGTEIVVESPDLEAAGQAAAKIELLCRVKNRDIRIFQDGCYITHKAGKAI